MDVAEPSLPWSGGRILRKRTTRDKLSSLAHGHNKVVAGGGPGQRRPRDAVIASAAKQSPAGTGAMPREIAFSRLPPRFVLRRAGSRGLPFGKPLPPASDRATRDASP